MSSMDKYDLVVVGAGPAGAGAAVQARLYGLKTAVISSDGVGGRLRLARRVDNFPWPAAGRPSSGPDICKRLERWLAARHIAVKKASVDRIESKGKLFRMTMENGKGICSEAVIVATGVRPKPLRIRGRGCESGRVFTNWLEVPRKRGACVAVVGGGEAAFDQACSLAGRGFEVLVLMRGEGPRAYPGLAAEAVRLGVKVVGGAPVRSISCDARGAVLAAAKGKRYCCDYVLPAVGHRPQLPSIDRQAKDRLGRGLWLAGDVREKYCRQAAVAFGDGVRAAMLAWEHLRRAKR